jgi:hypothetical protein
MEKSTNKKKKRSQNDNDVQNYKQHGNDKQQNPLHQTNEKIKTCSKPLICNSICNQFFVNTVKDWNNLPPDIAAAKSLESFKAQVAKLFE